LRYILEAFERGADGVYVVACPIGNCHHVHGNERAASRVTHAKALLDQIGIGGDRLEIVYASGGMGMTFADTARSVTERIREMGPSPLK
jgi:coenzyme F420-reducing hydrogenase delta subunit